MARGYSYKYVEKCFKDKGYKLLSESYVNSKTHLEYECSCGVAIKKTFDRFMHSSGKCKKCVSVNCKNKPFSINEVEKMFKESGCTLLEEQYISIRVPMRFRCKCGSIGHKKLNNVNPNLGIQCKDCSLHKGESHHMWNPDRDYIELRKKVHNKCRMAVRNSFRRFDKKKVKATHLYVGFTDIDLMKHLESFPDWELLKDTDWELDHIFPVKAFVDHGIDDMKVINALNNLQPLSRQDNLEKGGEYDEKLFLEYLQAEKAKVFKIWDTCHSSDVEA